MTRYSEIIQKSCWWHCAIEDPISKALSLVVHQLKVSWMSHKTPLGHVTTRAGVAITQRQAPTQVLPVTGKPVWSGGRQRGTNMAAIRGKGDTGCKGVGPGSVSHCWIPSGGSCSLTWGYSIYHQQNSGWWVKERHCGSECPLLLQRIHKLPHCHWIQQ